MLGIGAVLIAVSFVLMFAVGEEGLIAGLIMVTPGAILLVFGLAVLIHVGIRYRKR
jgi:hypothetical protein